MLELILGAIDVFIGVADLLSLIGDVVAWFYSRSNRSERRDAFLEGTTPPKRTRWTVAFPILTAIVIALTCLLIVRWLIHHT